MWLAYLMLAIGYWPLTDDTAISRHATNAFRLVAGMHWHA
jgi:hypothetical protein